MTGRRMAPQAKAAAEFARRFRQMTQFKENPYHPLVWIVGEPEIGEGVYIGGFSEVNAVDAHVRIGAHCDIASFVSINCADSHKRCIGLMDEIERADIIIEDHVFIGSHSFVMGGVRIGHHSVVGAGTIVTPQSIPPYSLVLGNPVKVKSGYYKRRISGAGRS